MRLLADENIPAAVVRALRERNHDVLWMNEHRRGVGDREVARLARSEQRALLTLDKDFRYWALRSNEPIPDGVLLIQLENLDESFLTTRTIEALESRPDWRGQLVVVTDRRVKTRSLKSAPSNS